MHSITTSETIDVLSEKSVGKSHLGLGKLMFLGIMAGAYIAIGYLAFIRVSGSTPKEWGSFSTFLGGCLFIPNWLISYHIFGWGVSHR